MDHLNSNFGNNERIASGSSIGFMDKSFDPSQKQSKGEIMAHGNMLSKILCKYSSSTFGVCWVKHTSRSDHELCVCEKNTEMAVSKDKKQSRAKKGTNKGEKEESTVRQMIYGVFFFTIEFQS